MNLLSRSLVMPRIMRPDPTPRLTAFAEPTNPAYNRRVGLRTTGSIGAALMLLLAPAAHADNVVAPWTLTQARAFAATQQVSGVDESQPDKPQCLVDLRRATVKPLGSLGQATLPPC